MSIKYAIKYSGTERFNDSINYGDSKELIDLVSENAEIGHSLSELQSVFTKTMKLINDQRPDKKLEGILTINAGLKDN
jgi:hypothetical protein